MPSARHRSPTKFRSCLGCSAYPSQPPKDRRRKPDRHPLVWPMRKPQQTTLSDVIRDLSITVLRVAMLYRNPPEALGTDHVRRKIAGGLAARLAVIAVFGPSLEPVGLRHSPYVVGEDRKSTR